MKRRERFNYEKMIGTALATAAVGTALILGASKLSKPNLENRLANTAQISTSTKIQRNEQIPIELPRTQEALPQKAQQKNPLIAYAEYTGNFEGRELRVYDPNPNDNKPEPTIGIGHYLDRGNSRETFARVLPEVDFDSVYNGRTELTDEQVNELFAEDIKEYVERTKRFFPKFDEYPQYLRQALVDGFYRGDLGDSPKTRELINQGEFAEASDEYINRKDYKNAIANGMAGIRTRMDANRNAMIRYAMENPESKE